MAGKDTGTRRVIPSRIAAVSHPLTGAFVTPDPTAQYPADDPLVRAYPWMFGTEEEISTDVARAGAVSVLIEDASARPGSMRATRRS